MGGRGRRRAPDRRHRHGQPRDGLHGGAASEGSTRGIDAAVRPPRDEPDPARAWSRVVRRGGGRRRRDRAASLRAFRRPVHAAGAHAAALASVFEGHADNAAAAVLGGFTSGPGGSPVRLEPHPDVARRARRPRGSDVSRRRPGPQSPTDPREERGVQHRQGCAPGDRLHAGPEPAHGALQEIDPRRRAGGARCRRSALPDEGLRSAKVPACLSGGRGRRSSPSSARTRARSRTIRTAGWAVWRPGDRHRWRRGRRRGLSAQATQRPVPTASRRPSARSTSGISRGDVSA